MKEIKRLWGKLGPKHKKSAKIGAGFVIAFPLIKWLGMDTQLANDVAEWALTLLGAL